MRRCRFGGSVPLGVKNPAKLREEKAAVNIPRACAHRLAAQVLELHTDSLRQLIYPAPPPRQESHERSPR
jgi:hypothetical protein